MEFGADFSHDEGKDDLLALRAALDNYHRADEPWVEKPFEATLLTARKIILSDETMGAIADLEIRLARYDTLIGCSPYRSTVGQLMSRFEGVCAAVANGFKPDWRTCCYLDYYLAHGAVPAVGLSAALAKATGADSQTVQSSLCAHQIEAIVTRLLEEEQSSTRLSAERIIALNDALCRTINPTWELGMRKWDPLSSPRAAAAATSCRRPRRSSTSSKISPTLPPPRSSTPSPNRRSSSFRSIRCACSPITSISWGALSLSTFGGTPASSCTPYRPYRSHPPSTPKNTSKS